MPLIDPVECTEHFQFGVAGWVAVLDHSSEWYIGDSFIRYDPNERLRKGARLARAAQSGRVGHAPRRIRHSRPRLPAVVDDPRVD